MTDDEEHTFVCPSCDHTIRVNTSMKDTLIEHGCVVCGATLSSEAFVSVAV